MSDESAAHPPAATTGRRTLCISTNAKQQALNGVVIRLTNTSDHSGVLITGLSLFGDRGRVRVLAMHMLEKGIKQADTRQGTAANHWDWRSYIQVADVPDVELSFDVATKVPFSVAVPLEPRQSARFYVYCDGGAADLMSEDFDYQAHLDTLAQRRTFGIAYRRFPRTLCATDEVLACRLAEGNYGSASA